MDLNINLDGPTATVFLLPKIGRTEMRLISRSGRAMARFHAVTKDEGYRNHTSLSDGESVTRLHAAWFGAELSLRTGWMLQRIHAEIAPQIAELRAKQAILDAI